MLRHLFAAAFLVALAPLSASAAPGNDAPHKVAGEKAKATKASVLALKAKLEKARDAIRALAKEAPPKGLTAAQKKAFDGEIAKLAPLAEGTDKVVKDLDSKLKDTNAKLDSLSEMGEMESLRLQQAMDRLAKAMETLSNTLKKISDTAQSITQNLK